MVKYTITYGRKVQVRQYESLNIELTTEFDNTLTGHDEGFQHVAVLVNRWIEEERAEL